MINLFSEILEFCGGDIDEMIKTLEDLLDQAQANYDNLKNEYEGTGYVIKLKDFNNWSQGSNSEGFVCDSWYQDEYMSDLDNSCYCSEGVFEKIFSPIEPYVFYDEQTAYVCMHTILEYASEFIRESSLEDFKNSLSVEPY